MFMLVDNMRLVYINFYFNSYVPLLNIGRICLPTRMNFTTRIPKILAKTFLLTIPLQNPQNAGNTKDILPKNEAEIFAHEIWLQNATEIQRVCGQIFSKRETFLRKKSVGCKIQRKYKGLAANFWAK